MTRRRTMPRWRSSSRQFGGGCQLGHGDSFREQKQMLRNLVS